MLWVATVFTSNAQNEVSWSTSVEQNENGATLVINAILEPTWHLYSQNLASDEGPIATEFTFTESESYSLVGTVEESEVHTEFEPVFDMEVSYFEGTAEFRQQIKILSDEAFTINAEVMYMICNDGGCLFPDPEQLAFGINGGASQVAEIEGPELAEDVIPELPNVNLNAPVSDCTTEDKSQGFWLIFLFGFAGGLFALLTPCVFPMIPLTVSFFTKGGTEKGKGILNAIFYGFCIFGIYAACSIPFHFGSDPEILNRIATNVWLNLAFFAVFVVFAISFFGYFEITLPSKWVNKTDSASNVGGLIGIFFMAITLVLVSFSCTGPILGTVMAQTVSNGPWPVTAAMSGFGVALGLPFALFAMFPKLMSKMPSSGGWLNTVKVVLGFIEIALAIKFLSNADMVVQWGLIHRETFFLLWAVIGLATALYLFGLIRFPHDGPRGKLGGTRLTIAALFLGFSVYLAPGVLKTPSWEHGLLAGFPPPRFYSWYDGQANHAEFTDLDEAMAHAMEVGKPVLLDFTGWACVNCRRMEENVWTDEQVEHLMENYIIVSLYVDEQVELPAEQQGVIEIEYEGGITKKKRIVTVGDKWATLEAQRFGAISQPFYALLSPDGYLLNSPVGYTPDAEQYAFFLQCGLDAYETLKSGDFNTNEVVGSNDVQAENLEPITWKFYVEKIAEGEYDIVGSSALQEGWHVYSQFIEEGGPIATTFYLYDENGELQQVEAGEPRAITEYDETFEMELSYFATDANFRIPFTGEPGTIVKGIVNSMVCNDGMCLPPADVEFEVVLE